ncbi:hypothetical protein V3C41_11690 [Paenarthrobacter nicotinovorans]|uniref:Uncharacterized protein n=1 Tax=Paenarthrobacter nicotinovorans TaxID=29320 RepID=A0ABV0GU07_PAENI|nr:hypothetical protein [Arthrobacter sp. StoSoilB20]BCW60251.1 hypothetical protein StoSoilB20_35980 [Arthrobacter sp. StoSoilB20]
MTTDPSEVAGFAQVRDGTTTPGNPIPRDPGAPESSGRAPVDDASPEGTDDAVDAGPSESANPPGPAEEKDEGTADDRGLTTEPNPTD